MFVRSGIYLLLLSEINTEMQSIMLYMTTIILVLELYKTNIFDAGKSPDSLSSKSVTLRKELDAKILVLNKSLPS